MTKSIADYLRAAADLIEPEGAWTQGALARDAGGFRESAGSGSAVCWCASGALLRVSSPTAWGGALAALRKAIPAESVTIWNDHSNRTQAEVVAALRKAADLAEAGQ